MNNIELNNFIDYKNVLGAKVGCLSDLLKKHMKICHSSLPTLVVLC